MRKFFNYFLIRFFNVQIVPTKTKKLTPEQKERLKEFWEKVERSKTEPLPTFTNGGIINNVDYKGRMLGKTFLRDASGKILGVSTEDNFINDDEKKMEDVIDILLLKKDLFKYGLCSYIRILYHLGYITRPEMMKVSNEIPVTKKGGYVWPPMEWEPREK